MYSIFSRLSVWERKGLWVLRRMLPWKYEGWKIKDGKEPIVNLESKTWNVYIEKITDSSGVRDWCQNEWSCGIWGDSLGGSSSGI